jgi:signal transduction histidine kinase
MRDELHAESARDVPVAAERDSARLIEAIQALSLARTVADITEIVRHAARELTGADGATFVLRDGDQCFYVDEDAIGPLWKGRRFPMSACISGWSMLNRQAAVVPDIYDDPRIPADAYRPTFVQSLAMVPIRTAAPIGAIGNYWASPHQASAREVRLLQALADSTSIALENVKLVENLERLVEERTAGLHELNQDLESFNETVSHDLRGPLQQVLGNAELMLLTGVGRHDPRHGERLRDIAGAAQRMAGLIDDLLRLSRAARVPLERRPVDVGALAREVARELERTHPNHRVQWWIADRLEVPGDENLLRVAIENLLGNAWKFTAHAQAPRIEVGRAEVDGASVLYVRDNGAGFDMARAQRLFVPFTRLHPPTEFSGTGIGLSIVERVVRRHGGRIWADSAPGHGTTFYLSLPEADTRS